jgi:hypothetical protein
MILAVEIVTDMMLVYGLDVIPTMCDTTTTNAKESLWVPTLRREKV